jgi:hypothetical protein
MKTTWVTKFGLKCLITLQALIYATHGFATPVTTGGPPMSLMVQLSTWWGTPASLTDWMNYICAYHRDPAKPGYIQNLVLMDVALPDPKASILDPVPHANDTLMTDRINALLPYFPGGDGPCHFDKVFVGTLDLQGAVPPGAPAGWSTYREGIKTPDFRLNLLGRQKAVALAFQQYVEHSTKSKVAYHWYVTQEAFLDYFVDPKVRDGYLAYMTQHIIDLSEVRHPAAFVWSPGFGQVPAAFPSHSRQLLQLQTNLQDFFRRIPPAVMTRDSYGEFEGGPLWLTLQDHVSSMEYFNPPMTMEDAAQWFYFLKDLFHFTSLTMNVEQFKRSGTALVGADPTEIEAREQYYHERGIPLGASFELRFWGDNNHQ